MEACTPLIPISTIALCPSSKVSNDHASSARRSGNGQLEVDRQVIETNLLGAIATIDAGVALFKTQGKGHIVGISSISAFVGIPGSAAYSASKAALTNYLSALRTEVGHQEIGRAHV